MRGAEDADANKHNNRHIRVASLSNAAEKINIGLKSLPFGATMIINRIMYDAAFMPRAI
jgi:hypothetical protein